MSNTGENALDPHPDESEPWRACLRDKDTGEILGAGVVLSADGVLLTCAHVVQKAKGYAGSSDVALDVELIGHDELLTARVMPGCWAPPMQDDRADVALLRLERPVRLEHRPRLRRLRCPRGRRVHAYGFPYVGTYGIYAEAVLSGMSGPGGEWVQIDSVPHREVVRAGFSGAGVVDYETGAVVGVAAVALRGLPSDVAWMIPIEVIVKYLPAVGEWLDPEIPCSRPTGAIQITFDLGDEDAVRTVRKIVDATGKSTDEISQAVHAISAPTDQAPGDGPVVVTGIEQAQDPEQVLDNVVDPLVRNGATVLLRLSDEHSPMARLARQRQRDALRVRIGALTDGVADLADREDLARTHRHRAMSRLLPQPDISELPALSAEFQLPLAALRGSVDDENPDRVRRAVERFERRLDRSLDVVAQVDKEAEAAMLAYERPRGLLTSYYARAAEHGLLEDEELDPLWLAASEALDAHPCDLNAAEARVDDYVRAVRRRLGGGP